MSERYQRFCSCTNIKSTREDVELPCWVDGAEMEENPAMSLERNQYVALVFNKDETADIGDRQDNE